MTPNFKTLLYREPRLFVLLIAMVVVLGVSSFFTIGKQEDPTITNLFATIVTPFPGADASRVESQVSKKIEDELAEIAEINKVTSNSRAGISVVRVELSKFINDQEIEQTWSEIRDSLEDARLNMPNGVGASQFDNDRTGAFTSISVIQSTSDDENVTQLIRQAKYLQDQLRQVSGTEIVERFGDPKEVVYVKANPIKLAALQLSISDLAMAVSRADVKNSAGRAETSRGSLLIEVAGATDSLQRLMSIPVINHRGSQVLLGDIAELEKTVEEPLSAIAYSSHRLSIIVAARMKPDLRVDDWTRRVEKVLSDYEQALPKNIEHKQIFSQSEYTSKRLNEVFGNLFLGVFLVVLVLLISMGWRAALVVAIVLPLTSLLSLTILQYVGIPIHQMSVTGLIVALGLLVDAAIVMTDGIAHGIKQKKDPAEVIVDSINRLSVPLLASTVTTALAFMPMAILPGPAGDFVGSIAIAVIVMLFSSLFLALTVTPSLSGWLLKEDAKPLVELAKVKRWFKSSLDWTVVYPKSAMSIALILPLTGFLLFPTLTAQFFPGVDRDQFYIQVDSGSGSSIRHTQHIVRKVYAYLEQDQDIEQQHWVIGESAPAFYYNMIRDKDGDPSFAEGLITTKSEDATDRLLHHLQAELNQLVPDAQVIVRGLVQGPPVNAPVEIKVFGQDLEQLALIGDQIRERMARVSDITHTRHTLANGAPKLMFQADENKAQLLGFRLTQIADYLANGLVGIPSGSVIEQTEEIPIWIRFEDEFRKDIQRFRHLNLPSNTSSNSDMGVPLSAIGEFELTSSQSVIARENGERVNLVQGFIKHQVLPEEVLKKVQQQLTDDPIRLPPGYHLSIGGDADARSETIANLVSSVGLIITLSIATIIVTFRSYRLSLITFIVCGLAAGLSLLSLAIMRYPFGIQALIGVIGSIGVSINAAIIILSALKEDSLAMQGDRDRVAAILFRSSRHIVSTTITTFFGFLPLILEGGGFWPPFAMAIAGGVLLSTIISFYFTPSLFLLWFSRTQPKRFRSLRREQKLSVS